MVHFMAPKTMFPRAKRFGAAMTAACFLTSLIGVSAADVESHLAYDAATATLRRQATADGSVESLTSVRAAAALEPDIPSDDVLTLLRSHGFGITGGYGRLTDSRTNLASVQVRFNMIQQRATTYVNRKNVLNREAQAPFGRMRKLSDFARPERNLSPEARLTDTSDLGASAPFLSGAFVWFGFTNKEVAVGDEKEKPLLAGVSLGFGPIDKGASTVHVDFGYAFYDKAKMPNNDFYVGLSIDLELFKKLIKAF